MTPSDFEQLILDHTETLRAAPKPWWLSKGVWGPIIVVGAQATKFAGSDFDVSGVVNALLDLITVIGAGVGWWGRVSATAPIDNARILPDIGIERAVDPRD